ncbi:hypothetical protein NW755_013809 [Fusarium falciforme]|uniref:Protein kinase domain-containing protein n=1 Tax=Fusarium falciforme TaxID=195108 RepID=A0A9W8QVG0_9HYPO|nr:hypothetical protein NW755_013809 [Fusarium falciforme]
MEDRSESRLSSFAAYITELSAKSETFQSLILGNTDRDARFNKRNHPIADLSHILTVLDVPGPYDLNFDEGLISSGAQFIVQNSLIGSDEEPGTPYRVAAKTPKFMLDCQERLNLSAGSVRRQVHDLVIEIAAMHHPRLRQHPNIVDMIGWGYTTSWHAAPFLALELAQSDLGGLVKEAGESMSFDDQRRIILDIASGLSAIHEIGIVHGDVKPENVLVFQEGGRWSAKLTDFGGGAVLPGKDVRGRGTVGWRAPELQRYHEYDEALNPELLWSIDIYSFGLICGYILCQSAGPSRGGEGERVLESALIHLEGQQGIPDMWRGIYQGLLGACLSQQPQDRPMDILTPLRDAETQMADMDSASQGGLTIQHATCDQEPQHQPVHIRSFQYSRRNWEIPEIRGELARDFLSMYLNNESHVSPAQAFGVFMNRQYFILKRFRDTSTRDIYIRLLRTAALGGIMQARSLIFRYYEYFELVPDDHVEAHREEWTLASIATGDLAFSERTRSVNQRGFDDAMAKFHANGGYNRHYVHSKPALRSCINLDTRALQPGISTTEPLNEDGDYLSHVLASFCLPETLEILKTIVTPTTVNLVNAFGESLLYRACSCGATETVAFLLDLGADPTLRLGGDGPSCLHWLFVFHPEDIDQVADGLIGKGASIDVKTNHNHKMLYYPYRFPAGSPLHWAVEFSCSKPTRALLRQGADPWLPNGIRQYIFSGVPPPVQPNSIDDCLIEPPILGPKDGSSALDLAVQNWDAGIVCLLLEYASPDTRASSSGIGVLHHLLAGDFRWISKISQIYCPVMRGCPVTRSSKLETTIEALLAFGFEINSLCLAWDYLWGPETTCTALMLAVYMANMQVAEALLRAGADVNITGSGGQTAIMDLGECYSEVELETEDYEFCKAFQRQVMLLLLAHGARIDGRSNNGRSPILALAVGHHIGAVEVLLENGAMINDVPVKCGTRQNDRQFPVLYDLAHPTWAIARDIDLADMMRTYALPDLKQAVQTKPDPAGMTILHSFVVRGFIESTGVLLETGIDVNAVYEEVINGKVIPITPLDLLYQRWPNLIHVATRRLPKSGSYASRSFQVSVHGEAN